MRIDLADGERTEHWYLAIRKGDVTVSHEGPEPTARSARTWPPSKRSSSGEMNAMAAVLRGASRSRAFGLMTALQTALRRPAKRPDRPAAGYARRRS